MILLLIYINDLYQLAKKEHILNLSIGIDDPVFVEVDDLCQLVKEEHPLNLDVWINDSVVDLHE